jgi:hypothetical protein
MKDNITDLLTQALTRATSGDDSSGGGNKKTKRLPLEEELKMLVAAVDAYGEGCPFKVRDLVTPRANSFYKHAGLPHVVIEVPAEPTRDFDTTDPGSHNYGNRLDLRIACLIPSGSKFSCLPYWVEAWQFEKWTPEMLPAWATS